MQIMVNTKSFDSWKINVAIILSIVDEIKLEIKYTLHLQYYANVQQYW